MYTSSHIYLVCLGFYFDIFQFYLVVLLIIFYTIYTTFFNILRQNLLQI